MDNLDELWDQVLEYCKVRINETAFNLWLHPIILGNFDRGAAHLHFANSFKRNTVASQYNDLLNEAFSAICGFEVLCMYHCPEDYMTDDEKNEQDIEDMRNDNFTFDNFIVGNSNKFAYTAAKAIAADPGGQISKEGSFVSYNPLFIYGNSGLGKTHLLNAICYEVQRNYPDMSVLYVKSEDFLNEFIGLLQDKDIESFREKYRNIDVFLVDDIQFIAGKEATEWEFFHTFNALVDNGKQVVLTSDRPPKEIKSLIDRLRGRFESGLLADIQPPEYETRCAIIKRKASMLNFHIDDSVVKYIAERIKSNIRQLEGITKTLHAKCLFEEQAPSFALAQTAIKDVLNDVQPVPVTIKQIIDEVSRTTGVSVEDIYSTKRNANISNARKMCIYIIREVTGMSYELIGQEFGKDHTTILYNIEALTKKLGKDKVLNSQVSDIIDNIRDSQF